MKKTDDNAINQHSKIADFYKFRPPYTNFFLNEAVKKMGIGKHSILLDLCCGRGELANSFSEHVKLIYAFDGSGPMLDNRIKRDNIIYNQRDLNNEDFSTPDLADHIIIGSAVHWLEDSSLSSIINNNLKDNGKVLVTHSFLKYENQAYFNVIRKINSEYKWGKSITVDFTGTKTLSKCGYRQIDHIHINQEVNFNVEYIIKNQLSYLYGDFYDAVMSDFNNYKKKMIDALSPLSNNGNLSAKLINWGIIYSADN